MGGAVAGALSVWLFGWSLEADRFGWSWFVGVSVTAGNRSVDGACSDRWSCVGDKRCPSHRHFGFEGLGVPRGVRVRRDDQRKMTRGSALLRSPLRDQNDRRDNDCEQEDSDDDCDDD